jgi:hypothetical protein
VLTDYVGAGARLAPERGLELDPARWAWQPKIDGVYARVSLDRRGRIANVLSRAGVRIREADELVGVHAGPPDSVLHGELEAHTEAANRAAAARGWRALHVFDVTRYAGRDVSPLCYGERYGLLHQARAPLELERAGRSDPWMVDDQGDAHDARSGRYTRPVPHDYRRLPIVPLARGRGAGERLWRDHVELAGGEGLVACRLEAPAGARASKRKLKASETLDCRVVRVGAGVALVEYRTVLFTVSARGRGCEDLAAGDVVEVAADGWYESSATPRFARITRIREDLAARAASSARSSEA